MPIAFVGAAGNSKTTSSTLELTPHASTADGHVMIAVITVRGPNLTANPITPPAGWTEVDALFESGSPSLNVGVYRRTAASEGAEYAWSFDSANESCGSLLTYSGVSTSAPVLVHAIGGQDAGSTTRETPSIDVTAPGCWVVSYFADRSGSTWVGPDTERNEVKVPATSASQVVCDSAAGVSTGSTSRSATASASTSVAVQGILALAPPVTGVGRVTGTGTARPVTVSHETSVGRASGAGTARPVTTRQVHVAGRVTATGVARPVSVFTSASGMALFPALSIQAAFSAGASTDTALTLDDPTRGKLDTGTLGDGSEAEPTWVELADRATEGQGTISRGSQRVDSPLVQYEPGTLSVPLANHDRALDPSNLDGPYVDEATGKTRVTAMRAVRVRATWANTTYELLQGTADAWLVEYADPSQSVTTLAATDGMKVLAGISRGAVPAVGDGETTGERIDRILDSAGWNSADRVIDAGDTVVQATTLEGEVLAELQLTADTEIGELYVDGGGRVRFRARNALLTDDRSATSQAVFGDDGDELPYKDLAISTDDATFFNEVRVTRATKATAEGDPADEPVEQVASDTASQALFYKKTFTPSSAPILDADDDALTYAQWLLAVSSEPELRFTELTIEPAVAPNDLWPQALGREIGDRITIIRRPPGGGDPVEMDCFIRGIEHTFGSEEWITKWTLQSATRYGGFLVLDDVLLGVLDTNRLAY